MVTSCLGKPFPRAFTTGKIVITKRGEATQGSETENPPREQLPEMRKLNPRKPDQPKNAPAYVPEDTMTIFCTPARRTASAIAADQPSGDGAGWD